MPLPPTNRAALDLPPCEILSDRDVSVILDTAAVLLPEQQKTLTCQDGDMWQYLAALEYEQRKREDRQG